MVNLILSSRNLSFSRKVNRFYHHAYQNANRPMQKIIHSFEEMFVIFTANFRQTWFFLFKRFVTKRTRRRKRIILFVVCFCLLDNGSRSLGRKSLLPARNWNKQEKLGCDVSTGSEIICIDHCITWNVISFWESCQRTGHTFRFGAIKCAILQRKKQRIQTAEISEPFSWVSMFAKMWVCVCVCRYILSFKHHTPENSLRRIK